MGLPITPERASLGENINNNTKATQITEEIAQKINYAKIIQDPINANSSKSRSGNPEVTARVTTHNGVPAVIFKASDYYGIMADECKLTLVGKFMRTRPQ